MPSRSPSRITKYVKLPVEIEAVQWNGKNYATLLALCGDQITHGVKCPLIITLEGTMQVSVNDYVIKGVNGECYPCKPDIFEKSYEVKND